MADEYTKILGEKNNPIWVVDSTPDGRQIVQQKSSFDEDLVTRLVPLVQLKFTSGLIDDLVNVYTQGSGSVTMEEVAAIVNSGVTSGSVATLESRRVMRYSPGQSLIERFSVEFGEGIDGTSQIIGHGFAGECYGFGFSGSNFGIVRRFSGSVEIREFTVSTSASSAGTLSFTLNDNDPVLVSITASMSSAEVAAQIATASFSTGGWITEYLGDKVAFISLEAEPRVGSYTFSAGTTGASGSFERVMPGVVPTTFWDLQEDWIFDNAKGSGSLPYINFLSGNVGQIKVQWLGSGPITFSIQHPDYGNFVDVHQIRFLNRNNTPTTISPDQPLFLEARNISATSSVSLKTRSMGGFNAGEYSYVTSLPHGFESTKEIGTSETPIASVRVGLINDNGIYNRTRMIINEISLGNDGGKNAIFNVILNPTLVGELVWTPLDGHASAESETNSTFAFGGKKLLTLIVGAGNSESKNLLNKELNLNSGDLIVFTGKLTSGASADLTVSFSYLDDI